MKLKNIQIRGFRSIENMTIPIEGYGHKVLVGKNESGKSNILKALRLLPDGVFNHNERKRMHVESYGAYVIFQFTLEQDEVTKCKDAFIGKFITDNNVNLTNIHTIESFYEAHAKILYIFNINQKGKWSYWLLNDSIQINDGWHYVNQTIPEIPGINIPADSYIHDDFIQEELSSEQKTVIKPHLSVVEAGDVNKKLHNVIKDTLELQNLPISCADWEYSSSEDDLPNAIDMDVFSQNPNACLPLKRMFSLSGCQENDIQKTIAEAKAGGHNSIKSLLDNVNQATNEYINSNWQEYNEEYKNVRIELRDSGNDIAIGIKDFKNTYDFIQRSDGFRRFISFLLLMTDTNNSLIILDEPETGLHPSSAKDLRDVLIKLGKQNIIVYATHSISMIDTENIENNLIIRKKNENTLLEVAKEDGISPGELVYEAIGYSIYEGLKKKNILLEGYTDNKILKSFMQGNEWKDFGVCYTDGLKNIKHVISMLELGNREYFILSDNDDAAKRFKKETKKKVNIEHWYTYGDLESDAITLEDFYTQGFFNNIIKPILKENKITIEESFFEGMPDKDRLEFVKQTLYKMPSVNNQIIPKIDKDIKDKCAEEATEEDIEIAKLKLVLNQLLEKIKPPPSAE